MKPGPALSVVLSGMSDREVLDTYQWAAKARDPLVKDLGRELLVRFHRADPEHFPRSLIDEYDAANGSKE